MAETGTRGDLVKALRSLDAVAVENPCCPGTPDVNCTLGWIECKWLRAWPKREGTPVRLDHPVLPSQKVWIRRRTRAGGRVWVVLRRGPEWFLFDGPWAAESLGTTTRAGLVENASLYCPNGLDKDALIRTLKDAT